MANLTEISIGARKFAKYAAIALGTIMVLRFLITIGIAYYRATHQAPIPPPTLGYGKLPKPKFPESFGPSGGLTFILETIEGKPPVATDAARVFQLPKKTYTFESGDKVKDLARRLNFLTEPRVDTVYYYFTRETDPRLSLFVDSTSLNFQYKYNYAENTAILNTGRISSLSDAEKNAKDYIRFISAWDASILDGKVTTDILIYDGRLSKMAPATALSTAQAVRVNFFRKDIDNMALLPDEFSKSHNYVLYAPTPNTDLNNILEISYIFWPIDMNNFATYPLVTGEEAYKALLDGNAIVVDKGLNESQITVRKIYLAYSDSAIPQTFMQPIWVFEGDNNFVAYYPAIRPEQFQDPLPTGNQ